MFFLHFDAIINCCASGFYSSMYKHVEKLLDATFYAICVRSLDARFRNLPIGGFKHVECLCGTPWIVSLEKTWFFQLCMIASTLFWSNSMYTFNGLIVLRIHF